MADMAPVNSPVHVHYHVRLGLICRTCADWIVSVFMLMPSLQVMFLKAGQAMHGTAFHTASVLECHSQDSPTA